MWVIDFGDLLCGGAKIISKYQIKTKRYVFLLSPVILVVKFLSLINEGGPNIFRNSIVVCIFDVVLGFAAR